MNRVLILTAIALAGISVIGVTTHMACNPTPKPGAKAELRTTRMKVGGTELTLEVADRPETIERGLMFRDGLAPDRGMLFVFADEKPREFWMKNVGFALDIIFLDARGIVVSTNQMQPQVVAPAYPSGGPAMYAIELKEGTIKRLGVKAGDRLVIPADVRRPAGN